jgi:hypothetical protein
MPKKLIFLAPSASRIWSMSLTVLIVLMNGSTSPYFLPHSSAKNLARWRSVFSRAGVLGSESGRTGAK